MDQYKYKTTLASGLFYYFEKKKKRKKVKVVQLYPTFVTPWTVAH